MEHRGVLTAWSKKRAPLGPIPVLRQLAWVRECACTIARASMRPSDGFTPFHVSIHALPLTHAFVTLNSGVSAVNESACMHACVPVNSGVSAVNEPAQGDGPQALGLVEQLAGNHLCCHIT